MAEGSFYDGRAWTGPERDLEEQGSFYNRLKKKRKRKEEEKEACIIIAITSDLSAAFGICRSKASLRLGGGGFRKGGAHDLS